MMDKTEDSRVEVDPLKVEWNEKRLRDRELIETGNVIEFLRNYTMNGEVTTYAKRVLWNLMEEGYVDCLDEDNFMAMMEAIYKKEELPAIQKAYDVYRQEQQKALDKSQSVLRRELEYDDVLPTRETSDVMEPAEPKPHNGNGNGKKIPLFKQHRRKRRELKAQLREDYGSFWFLNTEALRRLDT